MNDQVIQIFLIECRELLGEMEDRLLQADGGGCDAECINAIFRAAHTIKGSAGVFGFEPVVRFTHLVESVLDRVREGELALDGALVETLLECRDHLGLLTEETAVGRELAAAAVATGERLGAALAGRLGQPAPGAAAVTALPAPAADTATVPADDDGERAATDNWHISLRFNRDVLRNGLDPLAFLRYLETLGEIVSITTLYDNLPDADAVAPEDCYVGFELAFRSDKAKAEIDAAFDFVRVDAEIHILPPRSRIEEYRALIAARGEDDARLGEILVACGTLTECELAAALAAQAQQAPDARQALGDMLVERHDVQREVVAAALEKQRGGSHAGAPQSTIRVDAEKLDRLINLIGELVISGAGVRLTAEGGDRTAMLEAASGLARLIEQVRDNTLNLRMVQIGDTFNRFQRVVRDVAKQLGKDIRLVIDGADTELDKTVVEKIGDPLMHLVRNAMDHGIETADVRAAAGKPAHGTLRLNAYHDAGSIVIEVGDDGGGLKRERILAKAIERGLVAPGHELSDREVHALIFEAGFSTAEQVSDLSGRGVGMDVVRRNIEALRGAIEIDSAPGRGTTIRIRLPLTLAIIDGFLVGVGDASFVIPLDLVVECVEHVRRHGRSRHANIRGQLLPYVRLRDLFGIEGAGAGREQIVIVQFGEARAGLVVDRLHGEFQTVIKPLGAMFSQLSGISGSTILGSGEVALILDAQALIQQAISRTKEEQTI